MMPIIDVPVSLKEIDLSVRGWEVLEARVRIAERLEESYGENYWTYSVAYAINARREEQESDDFLMGNHDLLLKATGPGGMTRLVKLMEFEGPRWRDSGSSLFTSKEKLEAGKDFVFELTAVDINSADDSFYEISKKIADVPVEIVNNSRLKSAKVEIDKVEAFLAAGLWERQIEFWIEGRIRTATVAEFVQDLKKKSDFDLEEDEIVFASVETPTVTVEVVDESGFPIYDDDLELNTRLTVRDGRISVGALNWVYQGFEDQSMLMGKPAKVVVRIDDDDF